MKTSVQVTTLFAVLLLVYALKAGDAMAGGNNMHPFGPDTSGVLLKVTKGGMPYQLWPAKTGKRAAIGKYVKVNLMQMVNDSLLFTTRKGIPKYFRVEEPKLTYDLTEVYPSLQEGDSVIATQLFDSLLARQPGSGELTGYKKGDVFTSTLTIIRVFDREEDYLNDEEKEVKRKNMQEFDILRRYLKANKIKAVKTTGGSYVEVMHPGKGARVDSGKYVSILYTGRTLAGEVFDSNTDEAFGHTEPLNFTAGAKEMIAGFEEGMQLLRVGAKARIYIPSAQGYGKTGVPPGIQPFETIVYDVEVLSVSNKPAAKPPGMEN